MLPILLIHGYSSEGKDTPAKKIYGKLPSLLRKEFGSDAIEELNLSRWISLSDGVSLDDVSFAMERALRTRYSHLLDSGFHVIIHSTGALVVRNWIKKHSAKPSPIQNLLHLAGANFGSGLAHVGRGQLARWGRFIFTGTEPGKQVLDELEFGAWKTLDLHRHFLGYGNDMYKDYQVQEFCLIGSQTFSGALKKVMQLIPIRYVKEDSSDNTVRTCAGNLNFNYIPVKPVEKSKKINAKSLLSLIARREKNTMISPSHYEYEASFLANQRMKIPFGLLYETAHFGDDIGIVDGKKNRRHVLPLIKAALKTSMDENAYKKTAERFDDLTQRTLSRALKLKKGLFGWNRQQQYEGHLQIIVRVRDQFGNPVEHNDITFNSIADKSGDFVYALERMIEDKHENSKHPGTTIFYLRTIKCIKDEKTGNKEWHKLLKKIIPLNVEVTAYEPESDDIAYLPLTMKLSNEDLRNILQTFRTTIFDITLARLPSERVFSIETD